MYVMHEVSSGMAEAEVVDGRRARSERRKRAQIDAPLARIVEDKQGRWWREVIASSERRSGN